MSDHRWIIVPNWDRFQHYKDRVPNWIKVYTSELDRNPQWEAMSAGSRGTLVTIWILYALSKGRVRADVVSKSLGRSYKVAYLESLSDAGFIELCASKPLALTRSRERSTEKNKKETGALAKEQLAPVSEAEQAARAEAMADPVDMARDPEALTKIRGLADRIGKTL